MRLFPQVLVRVSGGPFEILEALSLTEATRIVEEIDHCEKQIAVLKQKLSDALYIVIQSLKDPYARVSLLNIKRDIYNERTISRENLLLSTSHLSTDLAQFLAEYLQLKKKVSSLMVQGEPVFLGEVAQARAKLREFAEDSKLQKGLLLSSQSLLTRINKSYLRKEPQLFDKSDHDTERSLIKYLSRMCAKTSPFSTFTNLANGKVVGGGSGSKRSKIISIPNLGSNKTTAIVSHIRLNNFLYQFLLGLLTKNKEIYRLFLVRPNPTITKSGDQYLFLTNSDNIESFQRLSYNPAIEICYMLTAAQKARLTYKELAQTIIADQYFDATVEEIEALLDQLIEYGFLEFHIGVSGIDPDWDIRLCETLEYLAGRSPLTKELVQALGSIRELASNYGEAEVETRAEILETAYHRFWTICMKLHKTAGLPEEERKSPEEKRRLHLAKENRNHDLAKADRTPEDNENAFTRRTNTDFNFRPEQMFYEDTTINLSLEIAEEKLNGLVSTLHGFLREISIFEPDLDDKERMRHYFIAKYGRRAAVDFQTFYEDYYREVKKPEAEKIDSLSKEYQEPPRHAQQTENGRPRLGRSDFEKKIIEISQDILPVPAVKQKQQQREAWLERLISLLGTQGAVRGDEVTLTLDMIKEAGKDLFVRNDENYCTCSFGAFIQLFEESQDSQAQLRGVVNILTPGFGKMISRFLHIFEPSMTDDIRNWNESIVQNALLAEACDASFFNANLHPPLMPFELSIPNSNNSMPVAQQIPVTELEVSLDEKDERLRLIHKPSRTFVYIFDLGLQNIGGRSQVYQLLSKFSIVRQPRVLPILNAINEYYLHSDSRQEQKDKNQERIRPRITLENQVILQRKAWFIPKRILPKRMNRETDWYYFARVNKWRGEYGIPDEMFMHIIPDKALNYAQPETRAKVGRVDYKPQYISFKNPFLVKLFESLIVKAPGECKIEEMLPNSNQLLKVAESRRVTEFVVQWYD